MVGLIKVISFWMMLSLLGGCTMLTKQLDASMVDEKKTVYEQTVELPPLEISSELAASPTAHLR
jgi:hypothetical protein